VVAAGRDGGARGRREREACVSSGARGRAAAAAWAPPGDPVTRGSALALALEARARGEANSGGLTAERGVEGVEGVEGVVRSLGSATETPPALARGALLLGASCCSVVGERGEALPTEPSELRPTDSHSSTPGEPVSSSAAASRESARVGRLSWCAA